MFLSALHKNFSGRLMLVVLVFFILAIPLNSFASEDNIRRRVAFKLFRATLAADINLEQKLDSRQRLTLLIVYNRKPLNGKQEQDDFIKYYQLENAYKDIKNFRIKLLFISVHDLFSPSFNKWSVLAGLYLLDELSKKQLQLITRSAIKNRVISYSPFKGDVEAGILGGIYISSKIQPYINIKTMQRSDIHLKPFFMKVIKRYEAKK